MKWKDIINNPNTTFSAIISLAGLVLCFLKQAEGGVALIGAASVYNGLTSKDANK